jgi:hypothetical protein
MCTSSALALKSSWKHTGAKMASASSEKAMNVRRVRLWIRLNCVKGDLRGWNGRLRRQYDEMRSELSPSSAEEDKGTASSVSVRASILFRTVRDSTLVEAIQGPPNAE